MFYALMTVLNIFKPINHLRKLSTSTCCFNNKQSLNLWNEDISSAIKHKIENHWSEKVLSRQCDDNKGKSYYVLPMFPYPSGNLHMGHVRVYSISDTIARFQTMNGLNVIHPIGWDSFGLPAENAAIERSILPQTWTETNIEQMRKQLIQLGFNFDWNREISTSDPNYYKWTQYIFLKLYEKKMIYQSKALVNWDPIDKTVLADEQVDEMGCSWRSGAKVEKKILKQWFIRTTQFAKRLYDGLDNPELENWRDIINLQKHWIGDCNGVVVSFKIKVGSNIKTIDVWSSDPYKFIHGQFLTISKQSILLQDMSEDYTLKAINTITNTELPVYITDNLVYPEGRDIYLVCPKYCIEDRKIADMLNLAYNNENKSLDLGKENERAVTLANQLNVGGYYVSSKLKDWLISRQRYWGTPIPIVYCEMCGKVPVPIQDLPVKLPESHKSNTGKQSLQKYEHWINCKCPKCNAHARRETDTMDTFVDSSWYYYRFLDPKNEDEPFSRDILLRHAPVDMYIGGKEHAVLHLYYARFMSYFLNSIGLTPTAEPFKKLLVQGMVMGQSFKLKSSGKYIPPENVEKINKKYIEKKTGEPVITQWEKMSKSKYNGENPDRLLTMYGCDTTRLLILADVAPATSRNWSDATFPGVLNWQHRLWITMREFLKYRECNDTELPKLSNSDEFHALEDKIWNARNFFTCTTTFHFRYTQKLSVGISRLQGLTNVLRNKVPPEVIARSKEYELALASLIIMLAPVAPHFCSELWAGFLSAPARINETSKMIAWDKDVLHQKWPAVDDHFPLSFQCKVDGADRCELRIKASEMENMDEKTALKMMLNEESVVTRIKNEILRTKFELYPGCRAVLYIFTNRKQAIKKPVENCN